MPVGVFRTPTRSCGKVGIAASAHRGDAASGAQPRRGGWPHRQLRAPRYETRLSLLLKLRQVFAVGAQLSALSPRQRFGFNFS